jgi:hypothetical protein
MSETLTKEAFLSGVPFWYAGNRYVFTKDQDENAITPGHITSVSRKSGSRLMYECAVSAIRANGFIFFSYVMGKRVSGIVPFNKCFYER